MEYNYTTVELIQVVSEHLARQGYIQNGWQGYVDLIAIPAEGGLEFKFVYDEHKETPAHKPHLYLVE